MNLITTDTEYFPYPKNDCGLYDDNEAVLLIKNDNEKLYDYPATDRGYDIQGRPDRTSQQNNSTTFYVTRRKQPSDKIFKTNNTYI